ncbi:hypothetical protein C812_00579 [Paenibacillus barengoltzii G22]|uniref:Uncharacterized protein n=1 Tax=Paenibacillus barengoltzii G22 TaxID=1235795 RepID=R9LHQ1_9BACL|nr:hypothetical protein C812_00579 [Paenibacillus barengoltzii G22]
MSSIFLLKIVANVIILLGIVIFMNVSIEE